MIQNTIADFIYLLHILILNLRKICNQNINIFSCMSLSLGVHMNWWPKLSTGAKLNFTVSLERFDNTAVYESKTFFKLICSQ